VAGAVDSPVAIGVAESVLLAAEALGACGVAAAVPPSLAAPLAAGAAVETVVV